MRQPTYHPLKRQFRSDALADFCAVYYSTLASFGHWEDVASQDFTRMQKHWTNQNYFAAARLFWARQKIERAFNLAGIDSLVRLGMFAGKELARVRDEPLNGEVMDFWRRPWTDKVEFMLTDPARKCQAHVACDLEKVREALGVERNDDVDAALYADMHRLTVRLNRYKSIRYISRLRVQAASTTVTLRTEPLRLSRLGFMLHTPAFGHEITHSLCVGQGDLEFSPFLLYEAPQENAISELNLFTVESVIIENLVDRDPTLEVRKKRINCSDMEGGTWSYVGQFRMLQRFNSGNCVRLLVKRPWGSHEAFILTAELISEAELLEDMGRAVQNDRVFRNQFELLPLEAFLEELPNDGDLMPIGSLSVGQEVEHPDHGRGVIVERSMRDGADEVKVKFYKYLRGHPTLVSVFEPSYPIESFWSNLKLTGVNPNA